MKRAFLCLVALLCGGFTEPAKGADGARDIMSEEELKSAVQQLNDPATEMAALQKIIKGAGMFLYELGSVRIMTKDPAADELRRAAARAARSHENVKSVGRALSSDERDVRFWGVMGFEFIYGRCEPWKPLLPRLEQIAASREEDAGIRREAIRKLQYYGEAASFLSKLQESPDETDPWVLMTLLQFDSSIPEVRARWYARAVKFLSGKDEALRRLWLQDIWGNVSNPSTAPMWQIEADPALVESLRQIAGTGSKEEKELASKAVEALAKKPKATAKPSVPASP